MEYDFPEPLIYLINSILPDRTNVENEFIRLELEFQYTTRSRLMKLLRFLAALQKWNGCPYEPRLLFIRNEDEDKRQIHKNSGKLIERGFDRLNKYADYWYRHCDHPGL